MTYNIRLDVVSDGVNRWDQRKDFLVSQIQFYDPDIFGIQEGLPNQVNYINNALKKYNCIGIGREGINKGESTSIFFDTTKYFVKNEKTFWLSESPDKVSKGWDASYIRICTYALFVDKLSMSMFWVVNTHLDNNGAVARAKGLELILKTINDLNTNNLPVILMGDFNTTPETDLITNLKRIMLDSKEASLVKPFGPDATFNNFKYCDSVDLLIDYIFISKSPDIKVEKYAVLTDSKNQKYPSDHFPVFIEISIESKEKKW